MVKVLVVEDEAPYRRLLTAGLESHDHEVVEAEDLKTAMRLFTTAAPDIVTLDFELRDGTGTEFLRQIREFSDVPVIFVSAMRDEETKIAALDAGADDFIVKPFSIAELLARIRANIRRRPNQDVPSDGRITCGELSVSLPERIVSVGGTELNLTRREYEIILLLARNAGKILTHREILQTIWGPAHTYQLQYLRVYITRIRKVLAGVQTPGNVEIVTRQGIGYMLRET